MVGQVPMIPMHVNTLVTCTMEPNCTDSAGTLILAMSVQNSDDTPATEDDYTYTDDDDCELDECNMYEMDGEMVYVLTPSWPYVPPCLKGTVSTIYGFTP